MSTVIDSLEQRAIKQRPRFDAGDRVRVHFQVVEGTRKRTQVFEGVVIKRQGSGMHETFTVRKQSFGVGVERTFPVHSPKIEQLEVAGRGAVRRAKLYYLRGKVGKSARVAERRWGIEEDLVIATEEAEAVDIEGESVAEAQSEVVPAEGEESAEATEQPAAEEAAPAEDAPADEAPSEDAPAEDSPQEDAAPEEQAPAAEEPAGEAEEPAEGAEAEKAEG